MSQGFKPNQSAAERREIRVFISSTFRDMQEEREELVKQIFPQLLRLCESRGVTWGEVDLRWGVPDEAKAEGKVLPLCLQEIEHCRPYFIGLLGERYGWVPEDIPESLFETQPWLREHLHQSVTALEILHGVLRNPDMEKHAFFYFRDPAYAAAHPGFTEEDPLRRDKLTKLKDDIRKSGFPVSEPFNSPKQLGEWVLRDLTAVIEELYPEKDVPDPLDRAALDHEAYSASRRTVYIGRQDYMDRLNAHAAGDGPPLVIAGESGGGKSALLANWTHNWGEQHPETPVLVHFIGAAPDSANWMAMLRRLLGEFQRKFSIEIEISDEPEALRKSFANALHMVAARGRLVLVLDALNQIEDRDGAPDLVWLPPVIPAKVRLVVSTLPGRPWDDLKKRGWSLLTVEPLTAPEREELIVKYLARYSKALSPGPAHRIAATPQTGNGLYLSTLLNELRQFGRYEKLNERIEWYLQAANPIELYGKVIERWEQDYGQPDPACENIVRESMTRLWAARRGLSETELLESLGTAGSPLPRALWSPMYLAAGDALVNRGGLLTFAHDFLRQAVRDRYLPSALQQQAQHLRVAEYFHTCDMNARRIAEEPWQLLQAESFDRLVKVLADLAYAHAIFAAERQDLLRYWARIEEQASYRISETYREVLENPQTAQEHFDWLDFLLQISGDKRDLLRLLEGREGLARAKANSQELLSCLEGLAAMYFHQTRESREMNTDVEELNKSRWMQLLHEHENLAKRIGDNMSLQSGIGTQAQLLIYCGQYWLARGLLERQRELCERMGDRRGLARCIGNMAFVHNQLFEEKDALVLLERAENICREIVDLPLLVEILDTHGHVYKDLDRPYEAIALWQEEAKLAADLGFRKLQRNALGKLDQTYSYIGADTAALPLLEREDVLCRELNDMEVQEECETRRQAITTRLSGGDSTRVVMQEFPIYDDPARRQGIIALLRTIAEPNARFLPQQTVIQDIQFHILRFLVVDLLLDPANMAALARVGADEYREKWRRTCEVISPLGEALHRNQQFLQKVALDRDFLQFLRHVGSRLLYEVLPSLGFSEQERRRSTMPLMRCSLLLMGDPKII